MIDSSEFSALPAEAKLLFALILDRTSLSRINPDRFSDSDGNIFVFYTIGEICQKLGCGHGKAVRLLDELEKSGLILKVRGGGGKPNKIIVKPSLEGIFNSGSCYSEKGNSLVPESGIQQFLKSEGIYNNKSNNKFSYNYPSIGYDGLIESIEEQIEYDCINADAEIVKEIVLIMADVISSTAPTLRIGGGDVPTQVVAARYRALRAEHIEYVVDAIENNTSEIRNMKAYLISALYNAPTTAASSASAEFAFHSSKSS